MTSELPGRYIDIVFDGPPGPQPGRFVEVENETRASIRFGEWVHRDDGYWVLRTRLVELPPMDEMVERAAMQLAMIAQLTVAPPGWLRAEARAIVEAALGVDDE